ncbi:subclass B1 metallo-beta-lactamase [Soonwooa sp.]|uniref:subclass B1 metallo-beta-lactamase n=1 Tax=Soonwooa sp. TaxID=1938592 RepID=UPI002622F0EF|nr:subclass B1 metallo-beta-lactamase [Soonwooa sp.]
MNKIIKIALILIFSYTFLSCQSQKTESFSPKVLYKSEDLIITQVSKNTFEHTSYKQTDEWGKVPCNGLIVQNNGEVIVFDTPTNDATSVELINWIETKLHSKIDAIVPTHFHDDCLGGLKAFHDRKIPSYAYSKTIELAKENNFEVPINSIKDSMTLKVGNEVALVKFFGEGHTRDNVVGYFPSDNVLFGGCLIKELNASKGYLGDANTEAWSTTVEKVKKQYPNVKVVIPGHGDFGDQKLLDYTIGLFKIQ